MLRETHRQSARARGFCSTRSGPCTIADFLFRGFYAGAQPDPCHNDFAEPRVGNANNLHFADLGMRVEKLLYFAGIDVLAAADNHIARTPGNVEASVFAHDSKVAGMQPAVGLYHVRCAYRVAIIALHHRIAAHADFTLHADGSLAPSVRRNHLDLGLWHRSSNGVDADLKGITSIAHGYDGRGFGLAVGNDQLADVHLVQHALHQFHRTRRAAHHAGAQAGEVEARELR